MVLIQEKVHRIFLARKTKNYRPRSFVVQDGSFALLNYRPACSIPLNRKPK